MGGRTNAATADAALRGTTALIVDDEPDIRALVAKALERVGFDTRTAANLEEARNLLERYTFDVCLTDMRLPDGNGIELVQHVQETRPELPVAVITAHGNVEAAVEAMKRGAFDFVSKPLDVRRLRRMVAQAVSPRAPSSDARRDDPERSSHDRPTSRRADAGSTADADRAPTSSRIVGEERLIGRSEPMRELRRTIAKIARTNAPVWVTGESGTGKELIARLIHENSSRSGEPFVAVNCGAIPEELVESELFGHRKGSFTGAQSDHSGLFRSADGGTLFLDEVAELPLYTQVKLLRAIQERTVRPVGSADEMHVDVRLLSASHKDLGAEVERGRFRHDLYYRLNVICIRAPSLRERRVDLPLLVERILERLCEKTAIVTVPTLEREAREALEGYPFPGNVRELENVLERALAMHEGGSIRAADLQLSSRIDETSAQLSSAGDEPPPAWRSISAPRDSTASERERILRTLRAHRWNRRASAESLGLTYRQLRYRIQQLQIDES